MQIFLLHIITWLETHQLPCPFKSITHFDCPGCGIQRSFVLLMKGDFTGSFLMYPALVPILLLFSFLAVQLIARFKGGSTVLKYGYLFCAGIILVSYIYKLITKTV
jgi:Protein of unknown function (DUF2752)